MKTDRLDYELPAELIAQEPALNRSDSRLLVLDRGNGGLIDSRFGHLSQFLRRGDCLVLNDTKVLAARFFARRLSGAQMEGLFLSERRPHGLRPILQSESRLAMWLVMLKGMRKIKVGERLLLRDRYGNDFCGAIVVAKRVDGQCELDVESPESFESILERIGYPPLPPYIRRDDDPAAAERDKLWYQTVYARASGAVAAPTAGLHFTQELLEQLTSMGVSLSYVTLHVGTGTFKPVTTENLEDHGIHHEWFDISSQTAGTINQAKAASRRVVAVGTTSVRVLETVAREGEVEPASGMTDLFITPGYQFKVVDAMITNFHLPRSTLLALVVAFAGLENIMAAYRHAIEQRYRFYSYGDAMLIA